MRVETDLKLCGVVRVQRFLIGKIVHDGQGGQDLVSHRQPLRDASATGAGIRVQKYLHGVIFTLSDVFEFKS